MSLPKEVKMTKDGGNYYRGLAFHYAFTIPVCIVVFIAIVIAICNPFWFRDSFFRWVETKVNAITKWRNYKRYSIYLGTDPTMWHALKDTQQQQT